jgi:hypothetical protein
MHTVPPFRTLGIAKHDWLFEHAFEAAHVSSLQVAIELETHPVVRSTQGMSRALRELVTDDLLPHGELVVRV